MVIADEASSANLRWAGNTLTTNGVSRSRSLTVICDAAAGRRDRRRGVVSRSAVRDASRSAALVARPRQARGRRASPADDAQPLLDPAAPRAAGRRDWDDAGRATEIGVFARFAAALGERVRGGRGRAAAGSTASPSTA